MSSTLPNGEVRPTGAEGGEFADAPAERTDDAPPAPEERLEGDERMYTGEPVEMEDGTTRRPQQMNVGRDNMQGGGEWPDPDTPPSEGAAGADEPVRDRGSSRAG